MDDTQIQLQKIRKEWATQNEEIKKTAEEWDNMVDSVQESLNGNLAEIENTQRLTSELENLIDTNGRVKEGYEARVEYILSNLNEALGTEYKLTDNQITKNGEIIGSYQDIKKEIYNLIEAKKAQAVYDANMSIYTEALRKQQGYYNNLETSQKNYNKALEDAQGFLDYYKDENNGYGWIKKQLEDCDVTVDDIINDTDKWRAALGLINVDSVGMAQKLKKEAEEHRNAIKQNEDAYNDASRVYKQANDFIIAQDNLGTAILTGNKEEINKALENLTSTYETETGTQTATFSQRINNQIAYSNQLKERLIENNVEITEDTQKQLDAGIKAVAENLREQSSTVEKLTPDIVEAWKALGEGNFNVYEEQLNKVDPAIRTEIQNMTGIIVEKTPEVEKVASEMSEKMLNQLDNNSEMKTQAVENVKAYLQGLSDEEQREMLKQCGIDNVEEVMKGLKEGNLAEDVGINIIKGLRTGLQNNYWQGRTLSTAFTFASNVLSKFKKTFGISSPSRKTKKFGIYLLEGLGLGVKKESRNVLNTVSNFSNQLLNEFDNPIKEFSDGIEVDTKEFAINASEYVDYGAISGNISTKINNNNLGEIIAGAIVNGMQKAEIQVDIKAEAEEGVIVKKASKGFKEFVEQTGELPFPVPV